MRSSSFTRRRIAGACLVIGLCFAPLGWKLFGPRGFVVRVEAKTWENTVEIERRVLESGSAWCDELPDGATVIERRTIGDPSGRRVEASEHCRYSVPEWRRRFIETASGSEAEAPRWPPLKLAVSSSPDGVGGERAGRHLTRHVLSLRDDRQDLDWTCALPAEQWRKFRVGEEFRLRVDRFSTANCASVPLR